MQTAKVPFVQSEVRRHRDTLRYLAVRQAAPGDLGLGKKVMPVRGGRPAMRVRLLFTNIPWPEEKAQEEKASQDGASVRRRRAENGQWRWRMVAAAKGRRSTRS